ncbi:MAG: ATP-binding protein [Rhodoferax sp.]|nr:ATP-binding protein [Rhodoferax sp.]
MKIAILGAESTGKSTLCHALARRLKHAGLSTVVVNEYLREWCVTAGRTPGADEQAAIAQEQSRRIHCHRNAHVVADTTALMTAVYSDVLFQDSSLYGPGIADIRRFAHVLVTATDLPWEADSYFRDGPGAQQTIEQRLRQVLHHHGISYSMVYGNGEQRVRAAMAAVMPSTLASDEESASYRRWMAGCEKCSDAACEHRIFRKLVSD